MTLDRIINMRQALRCLCVECDAVQPAENLVRCLLALEDAMAKAFLISSGSRCPARNKAVGGVINSAHLAGVAVDIEIIGSEERYELLRFVFASNNFHVVEIAANHIHLKVSNLSQGNGDKPVRVCFLGK